MLVIGVTGGIGSGKTAATDRFSSHGIEIVDADIAARKVVEPGTEALEQIRLHFGDDILLENGELDRAALRAKIFSDPEAKTWLEQLLHPLIGMTILQDLEAATSPYVIFSSPLLFESGQQALCQRVLLIDVPVTVQIERTMQRDENDEAQVRRIIDSQMSREDKLALADDVICNDQGLAELYQQIDTFHQQYLLQAQQGNS